MIKKDNLNPVGPLTEFDQFKKDVIPGFSIIEQLGKGASGIVFKALDKKENKPVALKIFYLHYCKNKEFVRRLIREAETIKRLRHPNIVAGYGYGTHEGYYYTVMEYVEGETLAELKKKKHHLSEQFATDVILQVSKALEASHALNIIHRDIKPSNIMITPDRAAKLTDFGLAKEEVDTSLTMEGAIVGTPLYISPEQARGEGIIDIRSDIYALGITFYSLLTGKPPFVELNTSLLLTRKITDDIPPPTSMNPALSAEICAIIKKMCQRDRSGRYATPAELIEDIEKYLSGDFEVGATRIIPPQQEKQVSTEDIDKIIESAITDATLKRMLKEQQIRISPRLLNPSEILFYEEDHSRETYILLQGEVEILKAGRRVAVIIKPGSYIGEMSTLLQAKRTATVRTLSRTILLEIPEETFLDFFRVAPQMAFNLAQNLAARLEKTTEKLKEAQGRLYVIRDHYRFIKEELEENE
ncbi:protein kinase [Candidatus Sumerlaeota bacterium]|nr:protein kinase [Candidatus Sumerlaeota bacterium]